MQGSRGPCMAAKFLLPFVIGAVVLVDIRNAAWGSNVDGEARVSQASRTRRQRDETTQERMMPSLDASLPSQHVHNGRRRLQLQRRQPVQRKPKVQSWKRIAQGSDSKPNAHRKIDYAGPFNARHHGKFSQQQKGSIASGGWHPCPSYYLIGAMKCGTSSLNKLIMDNFPSSVFQLKKEYYVFPKSGPARLNWYGTNASNTFRTLDSTPKYLYNHRTPHQMKEMCKFGKTPRFVVTLCDPVRRAWSHYRHNIKFNHREMPEDSDLVSGFHQLAVRYVPVLRRCMDDQEREQGAGGNRSGPMTGKDFCSSGISGRGDEIGFSLYLEHLLNWFQVFQESQFLVLLQEEWTLNPKEAVSEIAKHFGLDQEPGKEVVAVHIDHDSIGKGESFSKSTLDLLNGVYGRRHQRSWESYVSHIGTSKKSKFKAATSAAYSLLSSSSDARRAVGRGQHISALAIRRRHSATMTVLRQRQNRQSMMPA